MIQPIKSLAAWSVVSGLLQIFRSLGIAYNEVVVSLLDTPGAYKYLRKFSMILVVITSSIYLFITASNVLSLPLEGRCACTRPGRSR